MKQLVQSIETGAISVVEIPEPIPGRGQVLVRVVSSLLSPGTERMLQDFAGKNLLDKARARPDLVRQTVDKARREGVGATWDAVKNRLGEPMAVGYSCAGIVIAIGAEVNRFQVGDRVACGGGGHASHAEVVAVPQNLVVAVPGEVALEDAAFATIGSIALHGIRLADVQLGETVAVLGLGLLGQITVQLLVASGCAVVGFDPKSERAELALRSGADATAASAADMRVLCEARSAGAGVDHVLITADTPSNEPVELAASIARDRASVVVVGAVGTALERSEYFRKELRLQVSRSYGPGRYDPEYEEKGHDYPVGYVRWTENRNMQAVIEAIARRKLDTSLLVTHRFPIDQGPAAFDIISGRSDENFMAVLLVHDGEIDESTSWRRRIEIPRETVTSPTRTAQVRLGVIGAGNFLTSTLLPRIKDFDELQLQGVCSRSGLSARHVADKFGFRFCSTDASALIADANVDAVLIATPHDLHADQVIEALAAGKHVYCEKPLCLNEAELDAIARALKDAEVILQVGYNRRFSPLGQAMFRFASERTGPLMMHYRVNAGPLPPEHWLLDPGRGGGRIIGEGCHFVDFLTFLCGELPIGVRAVAASGGSGGASREDVSITLEFSGGSVGTIAYSGAGDRTASKERVEAIGRESVMSLEDFKRLELVRGGRRHISKARFGQDKGHASSMDAFVKAILRGGPPPITYADIFMGTLATFRAREAMQRQERLEVAFPYDQTG